MKIAERTATWRRGTSGAAPGVAAAGRLAQAERYQRGEISQRPGYTDNPFRPR